MVKINISDKDLLGILANHYHLSPVNGFDVMIDLNQEGVSAGEPPIVKKGYIQFSTDACIPMRFEITQDIETTFVDGRRVYIDKCKAPTNKKGGTA